MLHENLRAFRKAAGLSQEELSARLNVVRQTVSKWENGLSVPDADMLIRIAEVFETSVSALLDTEMPDGDNKRDIAEQLSRINAQLATRNRRAKFVLKLVLGVLIAGAVCTLLLIAVSMVSFHRFQDDGFTVVTQHTETVMPDG